MKTTIAAIDKRGENITPAIIDTLEDLFPEKNSNFGLGTPSKLITEKDANILRRQNVNSSIAIGYGVSSTVSLNELRFGKLEDSAIIFEGNVYAPTIKTSITEILQSQLDGTKAVETFLKDADGDFSLITAKAGKIVAARDPIGVQPLYYGENAKIAVLASNLKALWNLGIDEPRSFPPGHLAVITTEGFKFEPVKTLTYTEPEAVNMEDSAKTLQRLLEHSVRIRVFGLKEVAVAFSGGLDSSVVAHLAKKYCSNVQLIHVSLENQPETEEAWKAAEELDLPLQVHLFKETDVEESIPKVLELIEDPEPLKVSVGVPFYWVAEKTVEAKLRVLLAGQGADELFGGYQRYVKEYLLEGDEKVRKTFFSDIKTLHETNIERDKKICAFHDVSLRLPFASFEIVKFAMSLPTELKFEKKPDSIRKLVLRRVAKNLSIPDSIAQKPKKAVQYSTGISDALKKLAKKRAITLGEYLSELFQKQMETIKK